MVYALTSLLAQLMSTEPLLALLQVLLYTLGYLAISITLASLLFP